MAVIDTAPIFGSGVNASFGNSVIGLGVATNNLFVDLILVSVLVIVILLLRNYELRDSLLSASVMVWLVSLVLWIGSFTDFSRVIVCFSILIVSVAMSYFKE